MTHFLFGEKSFRRNSIPPEISDMSGWPAADQFALSEESKRVYAAREKAMSIFLIMTDVSLREIHRQTGVSPVQIYRLFRRCLAPHGDGRIYGLRGLIPFKRVGAYNRTATVKVPKRGKGHGASGAFSQLLARYPDLEIFLRKEAKRRGKQIDGVQEVRRRIRSIHKSFLEKCREVGVQSNEYPLNQDLLGIRSMIAHLKKFASESFEAASDEAGSIKSSGKAWSSSEKTAKKPVLLPYEAVEFDGHKIDIRLTLKIVDPFGLELDTELHRIWVLVLLDVASRAVLGYHLSLGVEYNQDDIAEALQATLQPHRKRELKIPGLSYLPNGGFPSEKYPDLAYACWDWFRFDNAKSHLADQTLIRLTEIVGCWPDAGPAGEPNERPFVERFFSLLAANFAHRIPGTTGNSPQDVRRRLGDVGSDISLLITVDELEDLVDVLISNYNGEPHDGLGGRTPLEALGHFVQRNGGFVRTLAQARRDSLCLLQEARIVTVTGNPKYGIRPHINFEGARYSSDVLSSNPGLIKKKLRIYVNVRDLRHLKAFFEDGAELGILTVSRPWCFTVHSLRIRREILRLRRLGKLKYEDGADPVEAYIKYKRRQAPKKKRAANDLAAFNRLAKRQADDPIKSQANQTAEQTPASVVDSTSGSQEAAAATPAVKHLRIRKTIVF